MTHSLSKIVAPIALITVLVAGCSAPEPYVWRPYTIDREHKHFPEGPNLVNGSSISICYSNRGATPAQLTEMAKDECGRFGLSARFQSQDHGLCPLATPIAAKFACTAPSNQAVGGTVTPSQSQPGSLFESSGSSGVVGSVLPPMGTAINAEDVSTRAKSEPYPTFLFNGSQTPPKTNP